jgi:hypothetical protein
MEVNRIRLDSAQTLLWATPITKNAESVAD